MFINTLSFYKLASKHPDYTNAVSVNSYKSLVHTPSGFVHIDYKDLGMVKWAISSALTALKLDYSEHLKVFYALTKD